MRFEHGLPIEDNASDRQDSVRLAAICNFFSFPVPVPPIDIRRYFLPAKKIIVRSPIEYIYDLSRDQWICFVSAAPADLIDRQYVNGRDLMSPAVAGHEARCKGNQASRWQNAWLWCEMLFHARVTPLSEPNQILMMAMKAGKIKTYCRMNPQWRKALKIYWVESRKKPETALCEHIIKVIEEQLGH